MASAAQDEYLTTEERRTLAALCDTLIPPLEHSPDPHGYWARCASDLGVPQLVETATRRLTPESQQAQFKRFLALLGNPLTAAVLTGHFRPFADLPPATREEVLQRWAVSPLGQLRQAFLGLKRLACGLYYSVTDEAGRNPNWPALGYPGPIRPPPQQPKPIRPITVERATTLDCDVVVVGSGAGGGVVAGELAAGGKDVVVLEKGGYYDESDFDGNEYTAYQRLYEQQGVLTTGDLAVVVLAGSTLGGGTVINWAASFRTPGHVLEEWAREHHCPDFTGREFQASLEAVCARLRVNAEESEPNAEGRALMRGCERLGYRCAPIPRNVRSCDDCGWCGYGCPVGAKQSTLRTYLQDAAERGAQFVVNAECQRLLIEAGRAIGVEAQVGGHRLRVRAKVVVVAAGAIHSPAILLRSGLRNPNIGLNLRLHPTSAVYGEYPEPIETWRGVMMARYSDQFANLDGRHYGFMLEHPPAHPGLLGLGTPWRSGFQHKRDLSRAKHRAFFIVLTRDRDAGRVTVDRAGRPAMRYRLSAYDGRHLRRGLLEALRVHAVAGAVEIGGPHSGAEPFRAGEDLEGYLRKVEALGLAPNRYMLFSAHQMGTCRMGGLRSRAVLDPTCESWEVRNLFVADASTFPTSSGVNPMITIMAVAHRAAQYIKARC